MNNNRIEKKSNEKKSGKSWGRAKKKQKNPCWWHHFYYQNVGIWDKKENSRVFKEDLAQGNIVIIQYLFLDL